MAAGHRLRPRDPVTGYISITKRPVRPISACKWRGGTNQPASSPPVSQRRRPQLGPDSRRMSAANSPYCRRRANKGATRVADKAFYDGNSNACADWVPPAPPLGRGVTEPHWPTRLAARITPALVNQITSGPPSGAQEHTSPHLASLSRDAREGWGGGGGACG